MTSRKDTPETQFLPAEAAEQEELYRSLGGLLQRLLVEQVKVPPDDAVILVNEAFNLYYGFREKCDARVWIVAAACRNARRYLEMRRLATGDDADPTRVVERTVAHRDAAATLPDREREAIRLRFEKGKSYPEIGEQLGISAFAAKHMVSKAVVTIRGLIRGKRR